MTDAIDSRVVYRDARPWMTLRSWPRGMPVRMAKGLSPSASICCRTASTSASTPLGVTLNTIYENGACGKPGAGVPAAAEDAGGPRAGLSPCGPRRRGPRHEEADGVGHGRCDPRLPPCGHNPASRDAAPRADPFGANQRSGSPAPSVMTWSSCARTASRRAPTRLALLLSARVRLVRVGAGHDHRERPGPGHRRSRPPGAGRLPSSPRRRTPRRRASGSRAPRASTSTSACTGPDRGPPHDCRHDVVENAPCPREICTFPGEGDRLVACNEALRRG